jgi:septum formation protein
MYNLPVFDLPYPVILASGSPRRRELLAQLIPSFEVQVVDLDEDELTCSDPWGTAERLAQAKAAVVAAGRPGCIVIGGDTVVALPRTHVGEGVVASYSLLGKPATEEEACSMLRSLSGAQHEVITGVAMVTPHGTEVFSVTTAVVFRHLLDEEIGAYVATGEPMDKAGAYAIQGGAAGFVTETRGSLSNVIGLPLEELSLRLSRYAEMVATSRPNLHCS